MKSKFILVLVVLVALFSCVDLSTKNKLEGSWSTSKDMNGDFDTLVLTKDSVYKQQRFEGGVALKSSFIEGSWSFKSSYVEVLVDEKGEGEDESESEEEGESKKKKEKGYINIITLTPKAEGNGGLPKNYHCYIEEKDKDVILFFMDKSETEETIVKYFKLDKELDLQ